MLYRDHVKILDDLINTEFIDEFGYPILVNKKILDKKNNYYNYFTKGLKHNNINGELDNVDDFVSMIKSIIANDKVKFSKIPMFGKMIDPFSSNSAIINGVMQGSLRLIKPPYINSVESSNEMNELYAQAISRDVAFINYNSDETIDLVKNILNTKHNTLFRAKLPAGYLGPYISQLLLLDIKFDTYKIVQKYTMYLSKQECIKLGIRNEWGVTLNEAINIQNNKLNENPSGYPNKFLIEKFINDGRSLARAAHKDTPYQYYYDAYLILSKLGVPNNPTWPQINNNNYFLMATGAASVLCSIAEITNLSLYHAWYWKWQQYRKLRPEEFAIMITNVKKSGINKYGINEKILDSEFLNLIEHYNLEWDPSFEKQFEKQYVLPMTYVEGSPLHPAYPSGHAIIAGACCTLLKMMFDGDAKWNIFNEIYQASEDGQILVPYNGNDKNNISVQSEIDKLASNIAYGRNWAGIHYKSDANAGIYLGEKVAIEYMRDLLTRNNFTSSIKFKGFANNEIIVDPIIGELCNYD